MLSSMASLYLYNRNLTFNIDEQINNTHHFADLALSLKGSSEIALIRNRNHKQLRLATIHFINEIEDKFENLYLSSDKVYIKKLDNFNRNFLDLKNNINDTESLVEISENIYIDSLNILEGLRAYKETVRFRILLVNFAFTCFFALIIIWLALTVSNEVHNSVKQVSTFVDEVSLEKIKHSVTKSSNFSDFTKLESSIYKMANRIVIENRNFQSRSVNNTIGNLSENFAHLINNPLSIIAASARIIERKSSEKLAIEEAKQIEQSIERISKTTVNMKNLIRSSEKVKVAPFKVQNLCFSIELYYLNQFLENNIELLFEVNPKHTIYAIEFEISQCLFNLIDNSINQLKNSNLEKKWIKLSSKEIEDSTLIQLEDSGTEVSEEEIYNSMNNQVENRVGLFTVRQLISKNLGSIDFESKPNTCFKIKIPSNSIFDS